MCGIPATSARIFSHVIDLLLAVDPVFASQGRGIKNEMIYLVKHWPGKGINTTRETLHERHLSIAYALSPDVLWRDAWCGRRTCC